LENLDEKRNLIIGEKLAFQGDTPLKFDEQELAWQKKRLSSLAQGIAGLKKEKEALGPDSQKELTPMVIFGLTLLFNILVTS
jgi:hypothetical protein